MNKWYYNRHRPNDTVRNPIQGEFFSTDAIKNSAEALIREGIQNSLDATNPGSKTIIRIYVSGSEHAVSSTDMQWLIESNWEHLTSEANGLQKRPGKVDKCNYIVFEDFNTTGLDGDPLQWQPEISKKNNFFSFFRSDGYTQKDQNERGRWGIGKTVFPRSSRISTFWGLTLRASDNKQMLMGRTILKYHKTKKGESFCADGYFGIKNDKEIIAPIEDQSILLKFRSTFNIKRNKEPGLSIVIPYYDESEISKKTLLRAILSDYFYPILAGNLVVHISEGETASCEINANTLEDLLISEDGLSDVRELVKLCKSARMKSIDQIVKLRKPEHKNSVKWVYEMIEAEDIQKINESLANYEELVIRVPFPVREKGKSIVWSFFHVYLMKTNTSVNRYPAFIRDGIRISDVDSRSVPGIVSLVDITDKDLSRMLGDSENPAHTQWQKDCSHYKEKYLYGPSCIEFVAKSVTEILRIVSRHDQEEDKTLLIDLFSLPMESCEEPVHSKKKKKETNKQPDTTAFVKPEIPAPKTVGWRLDQIKGGFSIIDNNPSAETGRILQLQVAYLTRSNSNSMNDWSPYDFFFTTKSDSRIRITSESKGDFEIVSCSGNKLNLRVLKSGFRINVTGFDQNRNLVIKVNEKDE